MTAYDQAYLEYSRGQISFEELIGRVRQLQANPENLVDEAEEA